jgi:glutathione S-transferase
MPGTSKWLEPRNYFLGGRHESRLTYTWLQILFAAHNNCDEQCSRMPTLYHIPKTISSPIVQCMLELNLVESTVNVYETNFQEIKTASYLTVNPMGTSPAFEDGDVVLWESGAIVDYLLERYDNDHVLAPPPLSAGSSPEDIAQRCKYLQVKQYIIATVYPFMASLFLHTLKPVEEQDAEYVELAKSKWITLMGPVLTKWLGDGPYLLGSQMTAVDLLTCKPLNNASSLGLLSAFPELQVLLDSIRSRPSYQPSYEGLPSNKESHHTRSLLTVPSKDVQSTADPSLSQ